MAKVIKFALELKNGASARTIEDLRANFDMEKIVGYFMNGRLLTWLQHRHLDEEAKALEVLSSDDAEFAKKLCDILGVEYDEHQEAGANIDARAVMESHDRMNALRQVTADETILAKIDRVAFDEKDLRRLAFDNEPEVYLCNGRFVIPLNIQNKHYIGLGKVEAVIVSDEYIDFAERHVRFTNVRFDEDYHKIAETENPAVWMEKGQAAYDAGDYTGAMQWYRKAADSGNDVAMDKIGSMYLHGKGVDENPEYAAQWYQKSADMGNLDAMGNLGKLYAMGAGVPQNFTKGLQLLKKAAEKNPSFCVMVGALYCDQGDFLEAHSWIIKAVESESIDVETKSFGMFMLGHMYDQGQGVQENKYTARKWYLQAVQGGNVEAMFYVATMFDIGEGGEENKEEAYKWYLKAAENGDGDAMYALGSMYDTGQGVDHDWHKASEWMKKAANNGNERAREWLQKPRVQIGCLGWEEL